MKDFVFKTQTEIEKMSDEEKVKYFRDAQDALVKAAADNAEELGATKEEIESLKEQVKGYDVSRMAGLIEAQKEQGKAIKSLLESFKSPELTKTEKSQINEFIEKNIEDIKKVHANKHGVVEFTTKAIIETINASNPDGIPDLVGVQSAAPGNVQLQGSIVEGLYNSFTTSLAAYPYTETVPKDGDYEFVAEKGLKPQIDFEIQSRYAQPVKVAAHICLTDESVQDIPGLQSIATNYLRQKHDLKKQDGILFGDGAGANPLGATSIGRAFVAGGMAGCVTNPNFMDVVNAIKTDIYTTHNYQDEMHYIANVVLINPIDFYCELVAAKDGEGLPLYPMASLFNQVTIGGCVIVPFEDIPAGKIFVCDMTKYNVSNFVPYTVRLGWINDDFIKNQFCMVGESRFHAYVRKLDEAAFVYDDIATVKAAISA